MSRVFQTTRAGRVPPGAVLASLLLSGCAMLVPPEKDPLYIRQTELDSRVARVERVIDSEGLVNLLKQIEQLQKDNQALREQVDQLQFKLDQAGTAQKQQYLDVDQRLQNLEKALGERSWPAPMRAASWMVVSCARGSCRCRAALTGPTTRPPSNCSSRAATRRRVPP